MAASSKRDVNVLFLGPTGCGKSRLCNVLLDEGKTFLASPGLSAVTKTIEPKYKAITHNEELVVLGFIDTQGLADMTMTKDEVTSIVNEAIQKNITHVNYFVIMLKPGRISDDNRNALEFIINGFKLDDEKRKKHVLFVLSHCEYANERLQEKYTTQCLTDRTIKRLLVVEDSEIRNIYFTGLPQADEVNESVPEDVMKWMDRERKEIMSHLSKPIEDIELKPMLAKENRIGSWCCIL